MYVVIGTTLNKLKKHLAVDVGIVIAWDVVAAEGARHSREQQRDFLSTREHVIYGSHFLVQE